MLLIYVGPLAEEEIYGGSRRVMDQNATLLIVLYMMKLDVTWDLSVFFYSNLVCISLSLCWISVLLFLVFRMLDKF